MRNKVTTMVLATMMGTVLSGVLLAPSQSVWAGGPASKQVGEAIDEFAMKRKGNKVGDGECATLVNAAFRCPAINCKTTDDYGVSGPDADYKWGLLIGEVEWKTPNDWVVWPWTKEGYTIRTGDIMQFRNAIFKDGGKITHNARHHTAIIHSVQKNGFWLLEQNVGNGSETEKRKVQLRFLNMKEFYSGHLWYYRPVVK